jgi:HK97 family phage portal protein
MNLRQRIASWLAPESRAVTMKDLETMTGPRASSGEPVSARSAEGVATVYACVAAIAETIGSLPLHVYRRNADGSRERDTDHPLHAILHDQPNPWQTAVEFREMMQAHVLLRGNAYAERRYDAQGRLVALVPIHPDSMTVSIAGGDRIVYDVSNKGGRRRYVADEIFHLRGRSDDGIVGRSPIEVARDAVGLAQVQNRFAGRLLRQNARPTGLLTVEGRITDEEAKRLREGWYSTYSVDATNPNGIGVLSAGMKFVPLAISNSDAQFIEQQQFTVEEIARIFRVPPVIIGAQRDANYSASVALAQHFVTYGLRRHLVAWEQAIARQLMTDRARATHYAEHSLDGLLRGDPKTRADLYHLALADGWMTQNEVRRLENLPPVPGGDVPAPRTLPGPQGQLTGEQPAPSRGT